MKVEMKFKWEIQGTSAIFCCGSGLDDIDRAICHEIGSSFCVCVCPMIDFVIYSGARVSAL